MIAYSYIENNLDQLDKRYVKSKTSRDASYYSKLAILELCGWIEMSIDDCIVRSANRILKDTEIVNG